MQPSQLHKLAARRNCVFIGNVNIVNFNILLSRLPKCTKMSVLSAMGPVKNASIAMLMVIAGAMSQKPFCTAECKGL